MGDGSLATKREELETRRSNLADLELQAAKYGTLDVPVRVTRSMDEERESIAELETDIALLEVRDAQRVTRTLAEREHFMADNSSETLQQLLRRLEAALVRLEERTKGWQVILENKLGYIEKDLAGLRAEIKDQDANNRAQRRYLWFVTLILAATSLSVVVILTVSR